MNSEYKRTPTAFGPFPGPRQSLTGIKHRNSVTTTLTATITFKTLKADIESLLPNSNYSFQTPSADIYAYASLVSKRLGNLDWLAGRGYDLYSLYIHGVQYTRPEDSQVYRGSYLPVVFENMADPIISGREELGWPKLFSDIAVQHNGDSYEVALSWHGSSFGRVTMEGLEEVSGTPKLKTPASPASAGEDKGVLLHRYVPGVGRPGMADADYQVWIDAAKDAEVVMTNVKRKWVARKSSFQFDGLDWQRLPTLHHIIARMAEFTVVEVIEGVVVEGVGCSDLSSSKKI
jgi:Acetoacetate decarboxylase (ADC)